MIPMTALRPTAKPPMAAQRDSLLALPEGTRVFVTLEAQVPGPVMSTVDRLRLVDGLDPIHAVDALRQFVGAAHPVDTIPEVPAYARAVADALVDARERLEGPLPVEVRPILEQEAQTLGITLGSILARQYLESMDA
jgi:hypothetical protein